MYANIAAPGGCLFTIAYHDKAVNPESEPEDKT